MRWVQLDRSGRVWALQDDDRQLAYVGWFGAPDRGTHDVKVRCDRNGPRCGGRHLQDEGGCDDSHYRLGLSMAQAAEHIGQVLGAEVPPPPETHAKSWTRKDSLGEI